MLKVELKRPNLSLGIVYGSLRGLQVGRALSTFASGESERFQFPSAPKLTLGESSRVTRLELGSGLGH